MPPGDFIPDPEWVMLGQSQPEGVVVFASRTLSIAELRAALIHVTGGSANRFEKAWELAVTMDDVFWATGTDYGDAIRRLFNLWNPDVNDTRGEIASTIALPAPSRELSRSPGGDGVHDDRESGVGWAKRAGDYLPPGAYS